ncbi:hypothetical protein XI07_15795 [Bradyrhizobium sp. CCBAU 11445]|uniref:hypothetical protein n=1 Tax=unclassified Bradyrhizobium TaxID=2631580 RepID=UPI002304F239|nr:MULTISPECIES: hypothetical protein [unclassified Bradyrhizobium]MDA9483447.1 hypothetical protein [Bradyrhizobium sp. CCBAU 11445]MDA9523318.1 hypothetical protein [Bradyrhizobium sp. CCBAU 11434]
MMQENELLVRSLENLGADGDALLDMLSSEDEQKLRDALAGFLVDTANSGGAVETATADLPAGQNFKSILYRTPGAQTNRILTFKFKDAALDTIFPILGIVLTIYTTGKFALPAIPQIAGVLKTLSSKLVVLKRPDDANAIDALNSICRVRAKHIRSGANEHPTTAELERDSGLPMDALIAALKSLRSRGLIEATAWGAQTDDMSDMGNRWSVAL